MRKIDKIIIHCTATREGDNISPSQIKEWHLVRGFKTIGYHFVITLDGRTHVTRSLSQVGAHCKGQNKNSIGICYVGGLDRNGKPKDTRTPAQKSTLKRLINVLKQNYPSASIHGHNEFANKACPCFDVSELVRTLND